MNILTEDKLKARSWILEKTMIDSEPCFTFETFGENDVQLESSTASGIEKKIKTYLLTL